MITAIKRKVKQLLGFFPSKLPVGMAAFQSYIDELQATYDLPTSDRDSVEFAVATMIMHLGPTAAYKPKFYFYISIVAGCAKQIAGATFHELKLRQQAIAIKPAEVTATDNAVTTNASTTRN